MSKFERKIIDDGSAWTGAELAAEDKWIWKLDDSEIGEIEEALATAKLLGKAWQETTAADFPLVHVAAGLKEKSSLPPFP